MLTSCGNDKLYDESVVIPDAKWESTNIPYFDVNVDDTLTDYAFYMNIRHLDSYRYSNLFVFMHTEFPNGNVTHDTIECTFAYPVGRDDLCGEVGLRILKLLKRWHVAEPLVLYAKENQKDCQAERQE